MKRALAGVIALSLAASAPVAAQPSSGRRPPRAEGNAAPAVRGPERQGSLEAHLASAVAERLLGSDSSDDRVRGVERLASAGQREGIDRLVRALGEGTPVARDPRARLIAVRSLAPYAAREPVRLALAKMLSTETGSPLTALARDTAAVALAASDEPRALDLLVAALRQGGSPGEAADVALRAFPPKSLASFGNGQEGLSAPLCHFLGRLGDVRAVPLLRVTLARGLARAGAGKEGDAPEASPEEESQQARVAAALALARLGDYEQVAVAEGWLGAGDPALKLKAAEILLASGARGARRALPPLMAAPTTRAAALALSALSPGPELVPAWIEGAGAPGEEGQLSLVLLGRVGGPAATAKLGALLRDPSRAWDAAFALARAPGDEARRALEAALARPETARLAARAATVRALALRDAPAGLGGSLRSLFASKDAADRAAGAYGLAALGKVAVRDLVSSRDPAIVRAAARAALLAGEDAARACAERLAVERDPTTRAALGVALAASPDASSPLSTDQLTAWLETEDPLAPLAAIALGPREHPAGERRLARVLEMDDPILRSHAALALALSPSPTAAARLARALRFETDVSVRRALVTALGRRREPQRRAALELAASLDPDPEIRESARLALADRLPFPLGRLGAGCAGSGAPIGSCYVAWISLTPSRAAEHGAAGERAGSLLDPTGLSLPVTTDPDGALVLAGVSPGVASFRLASSGARYEASAHDRAQAESIR